MPRSGPASASLPRLFFLSFLRVATPAAMNINYDILYDSSDIRMNNLFQMVHSFSETLRCKYSLCVLWMTCSLYSISQWFGRLSVSIGRNETVQREPPHFYKCQGHVCIFMCVYICVCVCVVWERMYMYVCVHVCIWESECMLWECVWVCLWIVRVLWVWVYMSVCKLYAWGYECVRVCVVRERTCMYVCICMCMHGW